MAAWILCCRSILCYANQILTYPIDLMSNIFPGQYLTIYRKIPNVCVYNQWPPDLLWAANRWTVLRWPHTYCRPRRTHGICPPWHLSPGCYHSQHAGKTHRQGVSVQANTVEAFSDHDCLIRIITCHSHSCIESQYDVKRWMAPVLLWDRDFTLDINTAPKIFTTLYKIK